MLPRERRNQRRTGCPIRIRRLLYAQRTSPFTTLRSPTRRQRVQACRARVLVQPIEVTKFIKKGVTASKHPTPVPNNQNLASFLHGLGALSFLTTMVSDGMYRELAWRCNTLPNQPLEKQKASKKGQKTCTHQEPLIRKS